MVFSYLSNQRSTIEMMDSYVQHDDQMNRIRGSISIKDEYKSQIGSEYRSQQQTHGKYALGKKHIRNADITAAERMYKVGYPKRGTINTIMRNSPYTANMTPMQKLAYREKLGRYMKKVEPLRTEVNRNKELHGIKSNRIKDMQDYGRVVQAQQKAKQYKTPVKPMSYKEFMKDGSPNTHAKYERKVNQEINKKQRPARQAEKTVQRAIKQPYRQRL